MVQNLIFVISTASLDAIEIIFSDLIIDLVIVLNSRYSCFITEYTEYITYNTNNNTLVEKILIKIKSHVVVSSVILLCLVLFLYVECVVFNFLQLSGNTPAIVKKLNRKVLEVNYNTKNKQK